MRIICKEYSYGVNAEIILTFEDFTEIKAITLVTPEMPQNAWWEIENCLDVSHCHFS